MPSRSCDEDVLTGASPPDGVRASDTQRRRERAAILAGGRVLDSEHIGLSGGVGAHVPVPATAAAKTLQAAEKAAILEALAAVNGHRKKAAERLGIGERTLYDKLKAYGIR